MARYLEQAGLATVVLGAMAPILDVVKPPRVSLVRAPLGKLVGLPHDRNTQVARVQAALELLESP